MALKPKKGKSKAAPTTTPLDANPAPTTTSTDPAMLLKAACQFAFDEGSFIDTKFFAFSRRSKDGKVYQANAVYANSWMLKAAAPAYFVRLLEGGFEGNSYTGSMDAPFPDSQSLSTSDYGYDSDSDLEQDEEDEETEGEPERPQTPKSDGSESNKGDSSSHSGSRRAQGKIVMLRHVAHATWRSLIFYLCTGDIAFAPLTSQAQCRTTKNHQSREPFARGPPTCSPKSMYRLADELGLEELKNLARLDIESKLCPDNIFIELFSEFTSLYDGIRQMEVDYVCRNARSSIVVGISSWLDSLTPSEVGRSGAVIRHIVANLAEPKGQVLRPAMCPHCAENMDAVMCYNCRGVIG